MRNLIHPRYRYGYDIAVLSRFLVFEQVNGGISPNGTLPSGWQWVVVGEIGYGAYSDKFKVAASIVRFQLSA